MTFDFCGPKVAVPGLQADGARARVRRGRACDRTFLQAKSLRQAGGAAARRRDGALPAQSRAALRSRARPLAPNGLEGKRIGIRSYTQTTGIWVRGILQHEYGVDLNKVTWVVQRRRPPRRVRRPAERRAHAGGRQEGRPDAARRASSTPRSSAPTCRTSRASRISFRTRRRPRWPGAGNTARYRSITCFCVDKDLADARPDVIAEIFRMLKATKARAAAPADGIDFHLVRHRGAAQTAGTDDTVRGRAEDHSARIHGGRAVRRCDAELA